MQVTDEMVEKAALSIRDEIERFSNPTHLYIEPEAKERWEKENPEGDYYGEAGHDELESYRIIARAALSAALSEQERAVEVSCIACEDRPSAENNPCAVCGQSALVDVPVEPAAWWYEDSTGCYHMSMDMELGERHARETGHKLNYLYASPPLPHREGEDSAEVDRLTRPIVGIENRTGITIKRTETPPEASPENSLLVSQLDDARKALAEARWYVEAYDTPKDNPEQDACLTRIDRILASAEGGDHG